MHADQCTTACQAIRNDSDTEFVSFVHMSFASPPISTFTRAVFMGWLRDCPRITTDNKPVSRATALANLDQSRQGTQSTKSEFCPMPSIDPNYQQAPEPTISVYNEHDSPPDTIGAYVYFVRATERENHTDAVGRLNHITQSGY